MSSSALIDKICASSNTSTSTSSNPRPKPCSRAPNSTREPFLNGISCSPFASRIAVPWLLPGFRCPRTPARSTSAFIFWNVFVAVRVRCAVQITVRFGNRVHSATTIIMTMNVLATCRGIDNEIPPTVAANRPSSRMPRITWPRPSCHVSNSTPNSRQRSSTSNHNVSTIPSGITTCRAASESRSVERSTAAAAGIRHPLSVALRVSSPDQPIQLAQFLIRRGDRVRRNLAVIELLRQRAPHRRQHVTTRTLKRLSDRLRRPAWRRSIRPDRLEMAALRHDDHLPYESERQPPASSTNEPSPRVPLNADALNEPPRPRRFGSLDEQVNAGTRHRPLDEDDRLGHRCEKLAHLSDGDAVQVVAPQAAAKHDPETIPGC